MRLLVILALSLVLVATGKDRPDFGDYKDYIKSQFGYDPHHVMRNRKDAHPDRLNYGGHHTEDYGHRDDHHAKYYDDEDEYDQVKSDYGYGDDHHDDYGYDHHDDYGYGHEEHHDDYGYDHQDDYGYGYEDHRDDYGYGHEDHHDDYGYGYADHHDDYGYGHADHHDYGYDHHDDYGYDHQDDYGYGYEDHHDDYGYGHEDHHDQAKAYYGQLENPFGHGYSHERKEDRRGDDNDYSYGRQGRFSYGYDHHDDYGHADHHDDYGYGYEYKPQRSYGYDHHDDYGYGYEYKPQRSYGYDHHDDYGYGYKPQRSYGYAHHDDYGYGGYSGGTVGYDRVRDLYSRHQYDYDNHEEINFADFHYYGYKDEVSKFIVDGDNGYVPHDNEADTYNYRWSYGINQYHLPHDVHGYDPAWDQQFEHSMLSEQGYPLLDIPVPHEDYNTGMDIQFVHEMTGPSGYPRTDIPHYENEEANIFHMFGSIHPAYDVPGYDPILDSNLVKKLEGQGEHHHDDYGFHHEDYGYHHDDYDHHHEDYDFHHENGYGYEDEYRRY